MAIRWREDLHRRWAIIVYADPYTIAEWDAAVAEILNNPISASPIRLLVDRRYCQAPPTTFVHHIDTFLRRHSERFAGGRVAIVTSDAIGYGVAQMTALLASGHERPCRVHAFHSWAEAEQWLDQD